MADLGSDLHCLDDLKPELSMVDGVTGVAQALFRRLITPRGSLWYDKNYGTDTRKFLNSSGVQRWRVVQDVTAECLKDERVKSARVQVEYESGARKMTVTVRALTALGPFTLVYSIGDETSSGGVTIEAS